MAGIEALDKALDKMTISFGEKEHKLADLTAFEMAELEDHMDKPWQEIDFGRMKPGIFVAYLFERRDQPKLDLEQFAKGVTLRNVIHAAAAKDESVAKDLTAEIEAAEGNGNGAKRPSRRAAKGG